MFKRFGWGWVVLLVAGALFVGCQRDEELGTGTVVGNDKKVLMAEETDMLSLNPDEQKMYDHYKKTQDQGLLKGADPILVAKLYVHAILSKDYNTEYSLYDDDPGQVKWSKAEHLRKRKQDGDEIASQLKQIFVHVQEVKFVEDEAKSGYIEFPQDGENLGHFQMDQDRAGIWKVQFDPLGLE